MKQSAFPIVIGDEILEYNEGMSLRDYFASQAIGPLMGSDGFEAQILKGGFPLNDLPRFAAEQAYEIADAMLVARDIKAKEAK